jgi:ankyrin repeat protein
MYNYLDMDLVDQGVVGGDIRITWEPGQGLEIVTDYWAPDTLQRSYINKLRDETRGQLSDGIGESGFQVSVGKREYVLRADTDEAPKVEVLYDGKPVPMPSTIARAARDGNMPLLEAAIASREAIDSRIQGYSGLHLAILHGHVEAALFLISKGANPNLLVADGDETPLDLCALSNSLSDRDSATVAQALLEHGADKSVTSTSGN